MERLNGFTLVELMITLAVAAILLTVAVPGTGALIKNNRIKGHTYKLFGAINYARSEAIKRRAPVNLCRSANPTDANPVCGGTNYTWTSGWLTFVDLNNDDDYDATDILLSVVSAAASGVQIKTNDISNSYLEYDPDGTTDEGESTARYAICDNRGGAHGRQINISPLGRPIIVKGSTGNEIDCGSPTV